MLTVLPDLLLAKQVGIGRVKDRLPANLNHTGCRLLQKIQTAQQRCLAAAGHTNHSKHFSLLQGEIDALQNFQIIKFLLNTFYFKNCHDFPLCLKKIHLLLQPVEQQRQDAVQQQEIDCRGEQG